MSTLSFDLRGFGGNQAPAPKTAARDAGVSVLVHGVGISALVLAPLLGATLPPETAKGFEPPLIRPITVSLPPAPMVASRLPSKTTSAPSAQPADPHIAPTTEAPSLTLVGPTLELGVAPEPGVDRTGPGVVGGDCAVGALCGTGPVSTANQAPASIPRVGGPIPEPRLLEGRAPVYPPMAQAVGVSGRVIVEAHVAPNGRVQDVQIVEGNTLFNAAALDSIRSRRYEPLRLGGVPTDFLIRITIVFNIKR